MLAWIPFISPLNAAQGTWYLLLGPLALGIAIVYRALREPSMATYWRAVLIMTTQIVAAIAGFALAIGIFVQWIIPLVAPGS